MFVLGEWFLTAARAAVHVPTATAVLADLHLGYNAARVRAGESVPLPSVARLLAPLDALRAGGVAPAFARVVVAGDLFEAGPQGDILDELRGWLDARGLELTGVVPGNHDRGLMKHGADVPLFPEGI